MQVNLRTTKHWQVLGQSKLFQKVFHVAPSLARRPFSAVDSKTPRAQRLTEIRGNSVGLASAELTEVIGAGTSLYTIIG